MGTNYYWHEKPPCEHCGRSYEPKHIGKSSAGWVFALHVYPDEGINTLEDWQERWGREGTYVLDEYGRKHLPVDMIVTILYRKGTERSRIDGVHCVGRGEGSYDLHVGEFS